MVLPDLLSINVLYSREVPHCGYVGRFYVEAQKMFFGEKLVILTLYGGLTLKIGFFKEQAAQLSQTLSEAVEIAVNSVQERHGEPDPSQIKARIGFVRYLSLRSAYFFFPDVIYNKECPSSFKQGAFFVQ